MVSACLNDDDDDDKYYSSSSQLLILYRNSLRLSFLQQKKSAADPTQVGVSLWHDG